MIHRETQQSLYCHDHPFHHNFSVVSAGCIAPGQQPPASPPATAVAAPACDCPALVFTDREFAFELQRTLGASYSGEADIGECLPTASWIWEGDFESWYSEWNRTADNFRTAGDESLAAGHRVTAMEAYYRAATYHRTAEFFLHGDPADPRIVETWEKSRESFRDALSLDVVPYEIVAIPYENTTLPGYFYMVDDSGKPRPLLIVQTGFDGCQEELHPYAMEGIRRGYNVLTFEGPGQGEVIRVRHIPFRHDWENVIGPVVDYAVSRPDVDEDRVALWGISPHFFGVSRQLPANTVPGCRESIDDGVIPFGAGEPVQRWLHPFPEPAELVIVREERHLIHHASGPFAL